MVYVGFRASIIVQSCLQHGQPWMESRVALVTCLAYVRVSWRTLEKLGLWCLTKWVRSQSNCFSKEEACKQHITEMVWKVCHWVFVLEAAAEKAGKQLESWSPAGVRSAEVTSWRGYGVTQCSFSLLWSVLFEASFLLCVGLHLVFTFPPAPQA